MNTHVHVCVTSTKMLISFVLANWSNPKFKHFVGAHLHSDSEAEILFRYIYPFCHYYDNMLDGSRGVYS